jgi:hypothetical protein
MRDYAKVSPQFWIGTTGKALRSAGLEAQLVALYLLTNPHANMLGLYYLPKLFISHETGLPMEGASKGLARCIEAQFCSYDTATEMVWVHEMAAYQVGEQLAELDKRCAGIQNEYDSLPQNPFLQGFFDRYVGAFHMRKSRAPEPQNPSPSEAPSKPHRSQEHEQEQEKEQEQEIPPNPQGGEAATKPRGRSADALHERVIAIYHEVLPELPSVRDWPERRRKKLEARVAERLKAGKPADQDSYWRALFAQVHASDFLCGRKSDWRCPGLEWLLEPKNFTKVIEGSYNNVSGTNGAHHAR